jgi:serine/threonine protein kinase
VNLCPYCQSPQTPQALQCTVCGAKLKEQAPGVPSSILPKPLPNGFRLGEGRFAIKGLLGYGAFGLTYKALHKASLEVFAIKEHFPSDLCERNPNGNVVPQRGQELEYARSLERFGREAQVLIRLGTCVERGVFYQLGTAYLVMDFLEGQTLESRLKGSVRLEPGLVLNLLHDLLSELLQLHNLGLLHRDIKPANIMLTALGAKLVDFGSVTGFDLEHDTRVSVRLLTPAYAPLEQYASNIRLCPATDLYALAASAYEALSVRLPTSALDRAGGMPLEHIRFLNPLVPERLARVLEDALSLRMDARPQDARAFLNALGLTPKVTIYGPNSL